MEIDTASPAVSANWTLLRKHSGRVEQATRPRDTEWKNIDREREREIKRGRKRATEVVAVLTEDRELKKN